jgi:hypothetical protein
MAAKKYRVITKVHLGGAEPPTSLESGEIIEIDGGKLKREGGEEIKLQYPGAINSAIKVGWIVPAESKETTYTPKAAGVEVRAATSTGPDRKRIEVLTVSEEERDLGHIRDIRPDNAPATHVAKDAGKVSRGAPTGAKVMDKRVQRDTDDGRVVGRIKSPTDFGTVEVGKDDLKARSQLDTNTKVRVEKIGSATGDVQEAMSGDTLEEVLPNAVSTGIPKPGIFEDDGVEVSGGSSSTTGGVEQGVEIAKIGAAKTRTLPADAEKALRHWMATGDSWDDRPVALNDVKILLKTVFRKFDAVRSAAEAAVRVEQAREETPKESSSPDPLNGVWDVNAHWKLRCKWARSMADDKDALNAILNLDSSKGVLKQVNVLLEAQV